ncbi:MAG TPA: DUF6600 domain-containing protein [Verrucomicrobiae bacterium]
MKNYFHRKTCLGVAVAIAALAGTVCLAQDQPMPPSADDSALPVNITPGSPLAEVAKLVQAGVDADTIKSYIVNCSGAFNLDADTIIFLKDEGLPSDLINTMMEHDKDFSASSQSSAPPPVTSDATSDVADTAPPTAPVTVNYFYDTLSPYGSWVDIAGYGRCWRPTVVIYDSSWQPYGDRGHWVYTDCGWYWDSDYSWGATFHYGRWFRDSRWGWCWWPDTVWSASWVTWRYSDDYCGWAPLPPFTVFQPGVGFYYRGAAVAAGFNFGLDADFFLFIPVGHFCDRRPRSYCVARPQAEQIYRRATVINNFHDQNHLVVNGGIPVERINSVTHRDIRPVDVGEIRDARRQGWRGDVSSPGTRNVTDRQPGFNQPSPVRNRAGNDTTPSRPQTFTPPDNRSGNRNFNQSDTARQNMNPPANNNNPAVGSPFNRGRQNDQSPGNAGRSQSPPAVSEPSRRAESPFTTTPRTRADAPAAQQPQMTQPVRPQAVPDQPPRNFNRQNNTDVAPRYSVPASPPTPPAQTQPSQSQPRNADRGGDQNGRSGGRQNNN